VSRALGLSKSLSAVAKKCAIAFAWAGALGSIKTSACTSSRADRASASSVCTTENGRYEISGHVTDIGGNRYQGTVISGNESGGVTMVHRGNQQSVTVTSPSGSAKLTLSRR
jgi:hypothetical protein